MTAGSRPTISSTRLNMPSTFSNRKLTAPLLASSSLIMHLATKNVLPMHSLLARCQRIRKKVGHTYLMGGKCEMQHFKMEHHKNSTSQQTIQQCRGGLKAWRLSSASAICGRNQVCEHSARNFNVTKDGLIVAVAGFFSVNPTLPLRSHSLRNTYLLVDISVTFIPSSTVN